MRHLANCNALFPVHDVEQEIRRRFDRLAPKLTFEEFRARAAVPTPLVIETASPRLSAESSQHSAGHCIELDSTRKHQVRCAELLFELERALLLCIAAKAPTPKPLLTLLNEALGHCASHDAHLARYAKEDEAAKRHCSMGGRARHRDHRRIQRLTVRFLRTKAPAGLWKSKADAADSIAPHLCMLGRKYGFAVSSSETTWARNVGKMIRADSRAAQIFQRHCASHRTNRCRRIPR